MSPLPLERIARASGLWLAVPWRLKRGGEMAIPVTPLLAADIIIELVDRPDRPIVLIERKNPPYGWALPGGFVDVGERLEQAAIREAWEEINLQVNLKTLL